MAYSLREVAIRALRNMYIPDRGLFAFRLRRRGTALYQEGLSRRYTAVALIGLAGEPDWTLREVLAGRGIHDVCAGLLSGLERVNDLGEVALTLWASRAMGHPECIRSLDRLRAMRPHELVYPTVELSWSLSSLTAESGSGTDRTLADAIAERLVSSLDRRSGFFPHNPRGVKGSGVRGHVCCFADLVYPIQALSHYYMVSGKTEAIDAARRCADRICELQGPGGQWWWHWDVRTGRVVERYPVYSVHQDSMGPMALIALQKACGADYSDPIDRSLAWVDHPDEINGPLIDPRNNVIWRKVARREPLKLVRTVQALTTRISPSLRAPGMDLMFPARIVDYESRPYHMGWILHAFPTRSVA